MFDPCSVRPGAPSYSMIVGEIMLQNPLRIPLESVSMSSSQLCKGLSEPRGLVVNSPYLDVPGTQQKVSKWVSYKL